MCFRMIGQSSDMVTDDVGDADVEDGVDDVPSCCCWWRVANDTTESFVPASVPIKRESLLLL